MPTIADPAIYDLPSRPLPPDLEWLDEFVCEGLIVEVLARLESGKEATVFVCRGGVAGHAGFVASALTFGGISSPRSSDSGSRSFYEKA
jgi:hypothetical protein